MSDIVTFTTDSRGMTIYPSGDYSEISVFPCNCKFLDNCIFGNETVWSSNTVFGSGCKFGNKCDFGYNTIFGEGSYFGEGCTFSLFTEFGEGSSCENGYKFQSLFQSGLSSINPYDNIQLWLLKDETILVRYKDFCGTIDEFQDAIDNYIAVGVVKPAIGYNRQLFAATIELARLYWENKISIADQLKTQLGVR